MEFKQDNDRIYVESEDGNLLAEVTFPAVDEQTVEINHTYVDESLRGQGIAGKLLIETVRFLRSTGKRVVPSCSYAISWFARHPEYSDLIR